MIKKTYIIRKIILQTCQEHKLMKSPPKRNQKKFLRLRLSRKRRRVLSQNKIRQKTRIRFHQRSFVLKRARKSKKKEFNL